MRKGQKHSVETRRRMSDSRKGINHPMNGKHHSEETRQKIRLARARQVITKESNLKRSETQKGRTFSKESLQKMSDHAYKRFADKGNHPRYGKEFPADVCAKISKALKGKDYYELHNNNVDKINAIKQKLRDARQKQVFPIKDTKIEVKIQNFLKELGIEFYTHQQINKDNRYQCDILIPSMKIVIECDGDYWHGNLDVSGDWKNISQKQKEQKIKDYLRTAELQSLGYKVLRLWENKINKLNLNGFNNILCEVKNDR